MSQFASSAGDGEHMLFTPQNSESQAVLATDIVQSDGTFQRGTPKPQHKHSPSMDRVPKQSDMEIKSVQSDLTIDLVNVPQLIPDRKLLSGNHLHSTADFSPAEQPLNASKHLAMPNGTFVTGMG